MFKEMLRRMEKIELQVSGIDGARGDLENAKHGMHDMI